MKEHNVVSESAWKRLRDLGVDVKQLLECIDELCPEVQKEHIPGLMRQVAKSIKMKTTKTAPPQTVASVKFAKAVAPRPIPVTVSANAMRGCPLTPELVFIIVWIQLAPNPNW